MNPSRKKVTFPCGNLLLEGILHTFDEPEPRPAVVVCHPHPQFGGTMHNTIVVSVCEQLADRGITALRFNFRGVENSQGTYGEGVDEVEDVRAAVTYLTSLPNSENGRIGVAGYSFGSHVGLREAVQDGRVCAVAGISPAIAVNDFSFLKQYTRPKFLIAGERDEFVPTGQFLKLIEELPEPKQFELTPFADHYWGGFQRRVGIKVSEFFADVFEKNALTAQDKCV